MKATRQAVGPEAPSRRSERFWSELVSSVLDLYREIRDALSEAMFYQIYGSLFAVYLADQQETAHKGPERVSEARELPFVKEALESMTEGGYPEAVARVFALLACHGRPLPLAQLHLKRALAEGHTDLLPETSREQQRRIRGAQEIIVRYEPERALQTLPQLLGNPADLQRLLTLLDRVLTRENLERLNPGAEQISMLEKIRGILREIQPAGRPPHRGSTPKCARIPQRNGGGKRYGISHQRHL